MRRRQSKSARFERRMSAPGFAVPALAVVVSLLSTGSFWVSVSSVSGQAPTQCADGIDNDGDGQVDALTTGGNPTATISLGAGNPFAIRAIVNAGGYSIPDNGAIYRDAATVNKVCNIQGYTAASGSECTAPPYENRCGWRSFGDNLMFAWNGSVFYSIRDNVWTSNITCVGIPAACGDGKDNDGDGKVDGADTGCSGASDATEVPHDAGCESAADQFEGARQCSDGKDNDGDGKADAAGGDPGCADGNDDDEADPSPSDPPVACPAHHASCGLDAPAGAKAECDKAGKEVEWSPASETCTLAGGGSGRCYTCVDPGQQCPAGYACGVATGQAAATCPKGQKIEWSDSGIKCGGGDAARCFRCVDDPDADPGVDDPPPMCPVACSQDADCGTASQCSKVQLPDGTVTDQDLCWEDPDSKLCVKKCRVPRCVNQRCEMAPPAEGAPGFPYVQCATTSCPAPRCGDGVVQAGEEAQDPGPPPDGGAAGANVCNVTGTSCAQIPDARACKEPSCVDVNGRAIANTSCTCPGITVKPKPTLDCSNGYRTVQGKLSPTPSCAGGWYIQAPDKTCNCIMAAATVAKPTMVASLVDGSSLLASSIVNNCSVSCVNLTCGPGDACFALMGWNTVMQQCAPANCAGREEECGMPDQRYGANMKSWEMCPGTQVDPPDTDPVGPNDPPGTPSPVDGEECDDANNAANDGCSPTCKKEKCGDGTVQQKGADGLPNTADDEKCDDGNLDVGDGCNNECAVETCGNGVHDQGEECDDGVGNSDTKPGACRMDCTRPTCDDGVIDDVEPYGEQCECLGVDGAETITNENGSTWLQCNVDVDGFPALCSQCRANYCGDGFQFNPGADNETGTLDDELCDAGPFNTNFPVGSGECTTHAQCPGSICVDGECALQVTCSDDADCHGGKCVRQMCMPGGCANDADCGEDARCFEGQCRRGGGGMGGCTENTDCPSGNCYPNGSCMPEIKGDLPEPYCRMDCKPIRCGDGVVDVGAGETCDEGEAMFKCNGFPQPACDCAIPSWGNPQFNTTCCPENQYCSVWPTATCPVNCGVEPGRGGAKCKNRQLEFGEECDVIAEPIDSYLGQPHGFAQYVYRPNRDGTRLSFTEDDGRWKTVPATIEEKYVTIDHEANENLGSVDNAWIISSGLGSAKTYFHLWDIPILDAGFSDVHVRARVDFTGKGTDWKAVNLYMSVQNSPNGIMRHFLTLNQMNAAVLEVVADEDAHKLVFTLYNSVDGTPLSVAPITLVSPVQLSGRTPIAIDALEMTVFTEYALADDGEKYACTDDCLIVRCGNWREDPGETCDDGNNQSNDGCSNACQLEICALPD